MQVAGESLKLGCHPHDEQHVCLSFLPWQGRSVSVFPHQLNPAPSRAVPVCQGARCYPTRLALDCTLQGSYRSAGATPNHGRSEASLEGPRAACVRTRVHLKETRALKPHATYGNALVMRSSADLNDKAGRRPARRARGCDARRVGIATTRVGVRRPNAPGRTAPRYAPGSGRTLGCPR